MDGGQVMTGGAGARGGSCKRSCSDAACLPPNVQPGSQLPSTRRVCSPGTPAGVATGSTQQPFPGLQARRCRKRRQSCCVSALWCSPSSKWWPSSCSELARRTAATQRFRHVPTPATAIALRTERHQPNTCRWNATALHRRSVTSKRQSNEGATVARRGGETRGHSNSSKREGRGTA